MIIYAQPSISDLMTKCMVAWSLGGEQIAVTAEASPPSVMDTFLMDAREYRIASVFGPYSYKWAVALIVPLEAA
jgi:hypothetical protein